MRSLMTWLMAGALAASLTWNWKLATRGAPDAKADATAASGCPSSETHAKTCPVEGSACTPVSSCGDGATSGDAARCSALDAAALGLDSEQRAALAELCERSCLESDRLEARADERQRALLVRLAESDLDPAGARALIGEVAELRRRSLEACVSGIFEVRRVLTPAQLEALLAQCHSAAERR